MAMNMPDGDMADHAAQTKPAIDVTDAHSALYALAMRNHGTTADERGAMMDAAAQHMPGEVDRMNAYDAACDDDMDGMM